VATSKVAKITSSNWNRSVNNKEKVLAFCSAEGKYLL